MTNPLQRFENQYLGALRAYLAAPSEASLERAYELGREAFAEKLSMLDIAATHHTALMAALQDATDGAERERICQAAKSFLVESLSTFEMTQRGYREAQETAREEREQATALRGLADASVAINAARSPQQVARLVTDRGRTLLGASRATIALTAARGDSIPDLEVGMTGAKDRGPLIDDPTLFEAALRGSDPTRRAGWLATPLIGRDGRRLGLLEFSKAGGGTFTTNDEAIAVQLAQLASVALVNARLYEREHNIARTLQRSLLPERLPDIPGIAISARYRAAGEGHDVGGDFYDAFPLADRRWLILVGDVCGKGAQAAAITALARYTVRATALREQRPTTILRLLNRVLLTHESESQLCTVACGVLSLDGRSPTLELTLAGHPRPLLLRSDGTVQELGRSGMLLGGFEDIELSAQTVELEEGDAMIFYTDGLAEAGWPQEVWSPNRLAELLAETSSLDPRGLARRLERAALDVQNGEPKDDIAILVASVTAGARVGGDGPRRVESGGASGSPSSARPAAP